jgi:hypothetical protein
MSNANEYKPGNRRQELRFRGHCQKVVWQKGEGDPAPGLLNDFSASGASIMVPGRWSPPLKTGEQIVLCNATASANNQIYQVRRVESVERGYVLAGCSRSVEVEMPKDFNRLPNPLSASVRQTRIHDSVSPRHAKSERRIAARPAKLVSEASPKD